MDQSIVNNPQTQQSKINDNNQSQNQVAQEEHKQMEVQQEPFSSNCDAPHSPTKISNTNQASSYLSNNTVHSKYFPTKEDIAIESQMRQTLASVKSLTSLCEFGIGGLGMMPDLPGDRFQYERPSLIPTFTRNQKLSYGPPTSCCIDPPSSGQESEEEILPQHSYQQNQDSVYRNGPTFKEAVNSMIDMSYITIITEKSELPQDDIPKILITNIEQSMNPKKFKNFLEKFGKSFDKIISPSSINIIFVGQHQKAALLIFNDYEDCIQSYELLKKKEYIFFNTHTRMDKSSVCLAFDKRKLQSEKWVGVVLRNLPNCTPDTIKKNFESKSKVKILSVECIRLIKQQFCSIIRVKDIEEAENVCKYWNDFSFSDCKKLKAHIHPYSCTKRDYPSDSHHKIFQKQAEYMSLSGCTLSFLRDEPKADLNSLFNQFTTMIQSPQLTTSTQHASLSFSPPKDTIQQKQIVQETIKGEVQRPKQVNLEQISLEHQKREQEKQRIRNIEEEKANSTKSQQQIQVFPTPQQQLQVPIQQTETLLESQNKLMLLLQQKTNPLELLAFPKPEAKVQAQPIASGGNILEDLISRSTTSKPKQQKKPELKKVPSKVQINPEKRPLDSNIPDISKLVEEVQLNQFPNNIRINERGQQFLKKNDEISTGSVDLNKISMEKTENTKQKQNDSVLGKRKNESPQDDRPKKKQRGRPRRKVIDSSSQTSESQFSSSDENDNNENSSSQSSDEKDKDDNDESEYQYEPNTIELKNKEIQSSDIKKRGPGRPRKIKSRQRMQKHQDRQENVSSLSRSLSLPEEKSATQQRRGRGRPRKQVSTNEHIYDFNSATAAQENISKNNMILKLSQEERSGNKSMSRENSNSTNTNMQRGPNADGKRKGY